LLLCFTGARARRPIVKGNYFQTETLPRHRRGTLRRRTRPALQQVNAQYKRYRQAQVAKAEKATSYSAFIERSVLTAIVRQVAMTGRMI
jgi:hypothetical protein